MSSSIPSSEHDRRNNDIKIRLLVRIRFFIWLLLNCELRQKVSGKGLPGSKKNSRFSIYAENEEVASHQKSIISCQKKRYRTHTHRSLSPQHYFKFLTPLITCSNCFCRID
jgi:hypothetical protein